MTKHILIIGIIAIVVIAILIVSVLLLGSDEPCVLLEWINFGMSRAAIEKQLGPAEEIFTSKVSNEKWYIYRTTYDSISVKVTLTFLLEGASEKLIGISLQNEKPMNAEEAALLVNRMTQQIRESYSDHDGYYEQVENHTIKLGVEEGAAGIFFTIEQQATAISAQGRRLY